MEKKDLMSKKRMAFFYFKSHQLKTLEEAVFLAEELVSNYYKMSSAQWLRSRYDIKTLKDLDESEIVDGPFAQVLGYHVRNKTDSTGSRVIDYYKVCIQDHAILALPDFQPGGGHTSSGRAFQLDLLPFLIYIVVHELVHIVRFATFKQIYSVASEADCAMEEERKVHGICLRILKGISIQGISNVLLFYEKWRDQSVVEIV